MSISVERQSEVAIMIIRVPKMRTTYWKMMMLSPKQRKVRSCKLVITKNSLRKRRSDLDTSQTQYRLRMLAATIVNARPVAPSSCAAKGANKRGSPNKLRCTLMNVMKLEAIP